MYYITVMSAMLCLKSSSAHLKKATYGSLYLLIASSLNYHFLEYMLVYVSLYIYIYIFYHSICVEIQCQVYRRSLHN